MKTFFPPAYFLLASLLATAFSGCVEPTAARPDPAAAAVKPALQAGQETFASPDAAADALRTATQTQDQAQLRQIFGPEVEQLLSGDATQDAVEAGNFSKAIAEMCNPVTVGDNRVVLYVGAQDWPFPIPLVRESGKWFFDTAAGKDEILKRRIGEDELTAISVCRAYLAAQHEYAGVDRDDSGVFQYAQRLNSTPGHHDGLYWEPVAGEELSPFGPLIANARSEGYDEEKPVGRLEPFHGYLFKILKEQGPAAPGGKFNYVINGNMIAGFALIAYPAHWGESGIMTFIVNQEGTVYQRNLGKDSAETAAGITLFNPDRSWSVVQDRGILPY